MWGALSDGGWVCRSSVWAPLYSITSARTIWKTPLPTVPVLFMRTRCQGDVFSQPLRSNSCLFWLHCSGFQPRVTILSPLRPALPGSIFPSCLPTRILHSSLFFSRRTKYPSYNILLDLTILITFGEEYKS
jgi:hypothetical protein